MKRVRPSKLGDLFREAVEAVLPLETDRSIHARVERILARLQAARGENSGRFEVIIPWWGAVNAFTLSGHCLYLTRQLYDRCRSDEEIAFVLAHEVAHHDLGHVTALVDHPILDLVLGMLRNQFRRYEKECEADLHALRLCERAGYDRSKCLGFFDTLLGVALDRGATVAAYGTEERLRVEFEGGAGWLDRLRLWVEKRAAGYPSIQERKRRLLLIEPEVSSTGVSVALQFQVCGHRDLVLHLDQAEDRGRLDAAGLQRDGKADRAGDGIAAVLPV